MAGGHKRADGEAGDTLIELLIAVMLLGIVGVAMAGGFFVALKTTTVLGAAMAPDKNAALILQNWGAQVEAYATDGLYVSCRTTLPVTPALPPGYTSYVIVKYWDGSRFLGYDTDPLSCPTTPDQGLQLLELYVETNSTLQPSAKPLNVVWRKPCESGC